jgi:hypothetical protein
MNRKLAAMSLKELVAEYNRLTNQNIRRFSSRESAEARVRAARASAPRTVRGSATAAKPGRPRAAFAVQVASGGANKVQPGSARGRLLDWLNSRPNKTATIAEAQEKFPGVNIVAVAGKLQQIGWIKRVIE